MRFRLIAFLPLAATAVALLLLTASSLVSAIDASLVPEPRMHAQPIRIQSFETECQMLSREFEELSRAATLCDRDPRCLGSPLLCPIAMDAELEARYQRLRRALQSRCEVSPEPIESAVLAFDEGARSGEASLTCKASSEWMSTGLTKSGDGPRYFVF